MKGWNLVNWTTRHKLIAGFAAALTLTALAGAASVYLWHNDLGLGFGPTLGIFIAISLAALVTANQLRRAINKMEIQMAGRAKQLEVVIDLSQRFSGILDLNELMKEVVTIQRNV